MHRPTVPRDVPLSGVVLVVLGLAASQLIPRVATPQQLASNVLLNAIPFVLIFAAIIIFYISFIWALATALKGVVPARWYNLSMKIVIGAVIVGILGMFQPWRIAFYTAGFVVVLISTLTYIVWSHVTPRAESES